MLQRIGNKEIKEWFGDVKISSQETGEPSIFNQIVVDKNTTVYIEEYEPAEDADTFVCSVYKSKKDFMGFAGNNIEEIIKDIKNYINQ